MRKSLERSCCSHWRAIDDRTVWCKTPHKDSAVRGQEGLGRDLGIETELNDCCNMADAGVLTCGETEKMQRDAFEK